MTLFCIKHPKYKGIRVPRVNCKGCWGVYFEGKIQVVVINLADGRKCYFSGKAQISNFDSIPLLAKDAISLIEPQKMADDVIFSPISELFKNGKGNSKVRDKSPA